jgi:competence protein ComEA
MNFKMKLINESLRNWFGYTRRERSSALILLLIIIFIIVLRYIFPERNMAIEDISSGVSDIESTTGPLSQHALNNRQLFPFDPNTASFDTLIKLGFSVKEANTLINYRNNGGKFIKSSDIKKIYGLEEKKAVILIPYVEFKSDIIRKIKIIPDRQQKVLIDINRCDSALLRTLPGIGPVLSLRIIKFRNLLGGFARIEQLKEVYGLPEETFNSIAVNLTVDTGLIKKINVNSADYKELVRFPYFDNYEVTAILKFREFKGHVNGITDLIENRLITEEKAIQVRPYLSFE